jgi:hypothetical protein
MLVNHWFVLLQLHMGVPYCEQRPQHGLSCLRKWLAHLHQSWKMITSRYHVLQSLSFFPQLSQFPQVTLLTTKADQKLSTLRKKGGLQQHGVHECRLRWFCSAPESPSLHRWLSERPHVEKMALATGTQSCLHHPGPTSHELFVHTK